MVQLWMTVALLVFHGLQHYQVAGAAGFVGINGLHFVLDGSPFYANGFNAYWLMVVASDPSQRDNISIAFQQARSHGLAVGRTLAFSDGGGSIALQYSPGSYNENMFKGLDFVISEAKKYEMRLILSLVNNYENYGGKKQYVNWANERGQKIVSEDEFFTNAVVKEYYKNHVKTVLTRVNTLTGIAYKDDPTIFAWELMNEPRCLSDLSGNSVQAWITEMAAFVKSIDNNHLLEVGLEGFYGQSSLDSNPNRYQVGTDFISNNQIPGIDFATLHSYPAAWLNNSTFQTQLEFLSKWIDTHSRDAGSVLRKPLYLTEFGKSWKDPGFRSNQRDTFYLTVYSKVYESAKIGGAATGCLFWQLLNEGMDSYRDGYEIIFNQTPSTSNIISSQSSKLRTIAKSYARVRNIEKQKKAQATRAQSAKMTRNKGN